MANIESLNGNYKIVGQKLHKENSSIQLLLRKRINPTASKPKQFILRLDTPKTTYVSSLYPTKGNHFELDYNSVRYTFHYVETTDNTVKVSIKKKA